MTVHKAKSKEVKQNKEKARAAVRNKEEKKHKKEKGKKRARESREEPWPSPQRVTSVTAGQTRVATQEKMLRPDPKQTGPATFQLVLGR